VLVASNVSDLAPTLLRATYKIFIAKKKHKNKETWFPPTLLFGQRCKTCLRRAREMYNVNLLRQELNAKSRTLGFRARFFPQICFCNDC